MHPIEAVNQQLAPLIQKIKSHSIYATIRSIEDLQIFMEHHVFRCLGFYVSTERIKFTNRDHARAVVSPE